VGHFRQVEVQCLLQRSAGVASREREEPPDPPGEVRLMLCSRQLSATRELSASIEHALQPFASLGHN